MKNTTKLTLVAIFAAAMTFSSCKKQEAPIVKGSNTNTSIQLTDMVFNEFTNMNDNTSGKTDGLPCKTVTKDMVSMPHTITIDYGTGCQTKFGTIRSGQMIVSFDQASINVPGCNITIAYSNYIVNDQELTGGTAILNNGLNGNGNLTFTFTSNLTSTQINSHVGATVSSVQTYEWLTGSGTNTKEDDTFSVVGSGSGVDAQGLSYTETITTPLFKNKATTCVPVYISGVVLNQTTGLGDRTTDYGSGACDNLADVTQNGVTQTITIQ